MNSKKLVEIAHFVSDKLISEGADVWLEYGSALGAIRSGGVVEGDDDIDLGIWQKDWAKLKNILNEGGLPHNPACRFTECFSGGEICTISTRTATGFTPLESDSFKGVDIYCFNLKDNHGWGGRDETLVHDFKDSDRMRKERGGMIRCGPSNYRRAFRSKAYYQQNLKKIQFEGFEFLISKYAEKYLDYVYKDVGGMGTDWRTRVVKASEIYDWEGGLKSYMERDKITGYTEGVFDLCHKGHIRLLRRMRDIFDKVVVAVTPDEIARTYKETPIFTYEERVEIIEACKYVDEVILPAEGSITTIDWMEANNIDYVVHGETDVKFLKKWYSEPMKERRLFLLGETKGCHTEDIKKRINNVSI